MAGEMLVLLPLKMTYEVSHYHVLNLSFYAFTVFILGITLSEHFIRYSLDLIFRLIFRIFRIRLKTVFFRLIGLLLL